LTIRPREGSEEKRRNASNWKLEWALVVALVVSGVVSSVAVEVITERYGAGNLLQFSSRLEPVANYFILGSIATAALMLPLLIAISLSRQPSPHGQALIWIPYAVAWLISNLVNGGLDITIAGGTASLFFFVSSALVLAFLPIEMRIGSKVSKISFRAVIYGSLIVAIAIPGRAFAPWIVWPGGWWDGVDRLQGLVPHPNILGWIAVLAVLFELFYAQRWFWRTMNISAAIGVLALTGSRTATIALVCGLALAILHVYGRRRNLARTAVIIGVLLVVANLLYFATTGAFRGDTFNGRAVTWDSAFTAFATSPVIGVGPGVAFEEQSSYAHNQVLQTLAELGLVGFLALVIHAIWLLRFIIKYPGGGLGPAVASAWFITFLAENMLRLASLNFIGTLLLFQLLLRMCAELTVRARRGNDLDDMEIRN
jgi:O-antigen ligase